MAAAPSFHINFVSSKERDEFMFNKDFMSDCAFVVEDGDTTIRIPCHKYILGCCSYEFYNFFYLLTPESLDIPISGLSYVAVKKFVEFVYKETIELDMEIVWDVLILAKRFAVKKLIIFCENFLSVNVEDRNLVEVLEKSTEFDMDGKLRREFINVIGRSQIDYFKCSPDTPFYKLSRDGLINILKSDYLDRKEIEVFRFINFWAENYCAIAGKPANSINKRLALGDALKNIRFGSLTLLEFTECTKNESILTDKEVINVFNSLASNEDDECPFSSIKRMPTATNISLGSWVGWGDLNVTNEIKFSLNKQTMLNGFGIYGARTAGHQNLNIQLKHNDDDHIIYQSNDEITFDGSRKTYDLCLNKGIVLEAGNKYSLSLGINTQAVYHSPDTQFEYFNDENGVELFIHSSTNHCFSSLEFQCLE